MSEPGSSERTETLLVLPTLLLEVKKPIDLLKKILLVVGFSFIITLLSVIPLSGLGIGEEAAPFPESQYGGVAASVLNLALYLVLVLVATFLLLVLIRKEKFNVLHILLAGVLGLSSGSLASLMIPLWSMYLLAFFAPSVMGIIPSLFWSILSLGSLLVFFILPTVLLLKPEFRRFRKIRNGIMLLLGAWVGAFMALFGEIVPLVLMAGFAVYDLLSVFKGPLGEIIKELEKGTERGTRREGDMEDLMLGLGDIVFYGIACAYAWLWLDLFGFLFVIATLIIGLTLTLYFLVSNLRKDQKTALPALPLPIFLSIGMIVVFKFLL